MAGRTALSDLITPFIPVGGDPGGSPSGSSSGGSDRRLLNSNPWMTLFAAAASFLAGVAISCLVSIGHLHAGCYELDMFQTSLLYMFLLASCIVEEFVFRFVLYGLGKKLLKRLKAPDYSKFMLMVVSAVLFSIAHIRNPEVVSAGGKAVLLAVYFAAGLYFACLYEVSGRVFVPFLMHLLNNILSTFVVKSEHSSIVGGTSLLVNDMSLDGLLCLVCELVPLALSAACVIFLHFKGRLAGFGLLGACRSGLKGVFGRKTGEK